MVTLSLGNIVEGKVVFVAPTHILVELKNKIKGLVHISEISDYFVPDISTLFKINQMDYFEVIEIISDNRVKLSWKKLKPRFLKEPFNFDLLETKNGFNELDKNTKKELEKNG